MDTAGARTPRPLAAVATPALALALALLALAGCGGSGSSTTPTPAQQLAQPGSAWAGLSTADQRAVLRTCRLEAAIGAATGGTTAGATAAAPVPRSGAFRAVLHLSAADLRAALDRRFADPAHASERMADGCRHAVQRQIARARIGAAPHADFGPRIEVTGEGLRLTVEGGRVTIPARLTPQTGARLAVTSAPGRAPSAVRAHVTQHGDAATVRLAGVPRGTSYLRATVTAGSRRWHRLITITGKAAPAAPAPRTFAPMVLHGEDPRGFAVVYVPRDARATVTTDGSPLTLATGRTVLLAHGLGAGRTSATIPAGRYEHVRVRARGPWSIRLVPAR
jgi:hypothetical protein